MRSITLGATDSQSPGMPRGTVAGCLSERDLPGHQPRVDDKKYDYEHSTLQYITRHFDVRGAMTPFGLVKPPSRWGPKGSRGPPIDAPGGLGNC